jgi:hypothetical protein
LGTPVTVASPLVEGVQAARSREPVERFKHERGEGSLFGACQIFELVPGFFPNPDHDADLALAAGGTAICPHDCRWMLASP